jgi:hypothetical protein
MSWISLPRGARQAKNRKYHSVSCLQRWIADVSVPNALISTLHMREGST